MARSVSDPQTSRKWIWTFQRFLAKRKVCINTISQQGGKPNDEMYDVIKSIYDDISLELGFGVPFDPVAVSQINDGAYNVTRALIESIEGGSDAFVTEGNVKRVTVPGMPGQPAQQGIQTTKTFEGWKHGSSIADGTNDSPNN